MGRAYIPLKTLKKDGKHTAELVGEDKQAIGSVTFKYVITVLK
jgi:hypothetical protein